jgi:cytochrome c oxidase subunit 2
VEVVWTIVPFLIVIAMALPATKTVVAMKDTTNADITIKATGYQWKWGYDYLKGQGEGISFVSTLTTPREQINNQQEKSNTYLMEVDNELVVPVNKKIRIVTTANDVIHAWMIPAFGVKQDAIPASCATRGSVPRRPASTVASAPSCAARNTRSCRSWCAWCPMPSTRSGSTTRRS